MQSKVEQTGNNKFNVSASVRNFDGMPYDELTSVEKDSLLFEFLESFGYIENGIIVDSEKRKENASKLSDSIKKS